MAIENRGLLVLPAVALLAFISIKAIVAPPVLVAPAARPRPTPSIISTPEPVPAAEPSPVIAKPDPLPSPDAATLAKLAEEFPPYQHTIGDVAYMLGHAHAIDTCHFQSREWYWQTVLPLEAKLDRLYHELPEAERPKAQAFAAKLSKLAETSDIGDKLIADCSRLAAMPFVYDPEVWRP